MNRCVALIGRGVGPKVRIGTRPFFATVQGLEEGEEVRLVHFTKDMLQHTEGVLESNGHHEFSDDYYKDVSYAQFEYLGKNKRAIFCVTYEVP